MAGAGIQKKHLTAFMQLGMISQLRGIDGSGVYQTNTIRPRHDEILDKKEYDFSAYKIHHELLEQGNQKIGNDYACDLFMGHVRSATVGSLNERNCHPFDTGNFVSCHNGTLADEQYNKKGFTDSELMFRDMEKRGVIPVLADLHKDSAYAVVVYDRSTQTVTFARNNKRSFAIAHCKNENVMFWASEEWMLLAILGRLNIEICHSMVIRTDSALQFNVRRDIRKNDDKMFHITEIKYTNANTRKALKNTTVTTTTGNSANRFPAQTTTALSTLAQKEEERQGEKKEEVKTSRVDLEQCSSCSKLMYPLDIHYGRESVNSEGDPVFTCESCAQFEDYAVVTPTHPTPEEVQ